MGNADPFESIASAGARLRAGETTSRALTEASLARIAELDPRLNAFITVMGDEALRAAAASDERLAKGEPIGPLDGIPVGVKDICETAGTRTTAGSAVLEDWVPGRDATVVERLRAVGAVIVGKTNMHEFAFGTTSTASHFGAVHNPWDEARHAGGSSGGSGAAVAAGECYAAIGTDTGGSVRIPAAMCGIVGLKPTYGLVSRAGVVPLAWSLDHVGPLARTVEDAALVLDPIWGHDQRDPASVATVLHGSVAGRLGEPVTGLRAGVLRSTVERSEPGVAGAFEAALDVIRSLGMVVEDVRVPLLDAGVSFGTVLSAEAAAYHLEWLRTVPDKYTAEVRQRLMAGLTIPAVDYVNEMRLRRELTEGVRELMTRYDVLLSPTCPQVPSRIEEVGATGYLYTMFTAAWNLTGQPVIAVPSGVAEHGMPASISFIGRPFEEARVCQVADAYERAAGWSLRPTGL